MEIGDQSADPGARPEAGEQLEAVGRGAAEYRDLAGPRHGMRCGEGAMGWLVLGKLRQIQQHRIWRSEDDGL